MLRCTSDFYDSFSKLFGLLMDTKCVYLYQYKTIFSFSQIPSCGLMQQGDGQAGREQQMAGETNYDAGGGQPLLRKKYHVVRKKNHVVRKKVYVASVFAAPQAPPCGCCWPMMAGRCKPHGRRDPQHSYCGREASSVYSLHRL